MPRKKTAKKLPQDKPAIKPISVRLQSDDWGKLREIKHEISNRENSEYSTNATIVYAIRDLHGRIESARTVRQ